MKRQYLVLKHQKPMYTLVILAPLYCEMHKLYKCGFLQTYSIIWWLISIKIIIRVGIICHPLLSAHVKNRAVSDSEPMADEGPNGGWRVRTHLNTSIKSNECVYFNFCTRKMCADGGWHVRTHVNTALLYGTCITVRIPTSQLFHIFKGKNKLTYPPSWQFHIFKGKHKLTYPPSWLFHIFKGKHKITHSWYKIWAKFYCTLKKSFAF